MKFKQLLAAGVLTVAATGITAATAYGAPVAGPSVSGVDGAGPIRRRSRPTVPRRRWNWPRAGSS